MTIPEWLDSENIEVLIDIYEHKKSIPLTKQLIKESIMRKLDLPDDDSFNLWYKLQ